MRMTSPELRTDVLIVGAGPAGLATAETIAVNGISVCVLERKDVIGKPVHTSGGTAPQTVRDFGIPQRCYHEVSRLRFCGPQETVVFEYPDPVLCILDVTGTYQFLSDQAHEAGADIRTSSRVVAVNHASSGGTCTIEHEGARSDLRYRVIVDASGYRAFVSKEAGLHGGFSRFGVGAELELLAPSCRQDEAVLIVGSEYAPSGYGWVFPWGNGRVRVGVGVHHADVRSDPRDHLNTLMGSAEKLDVNLTDATTIEEHFGLIPAEGLVDRFASDGIVAVGDSACQATLVVGEGIRTSLSAGRLAGDAIVRSLNDGTEAAGGLAAYEKEFRTKFERSLKVSSLINKRLVTFDDAEWDEKLRLLGTLPPSLIPQLLQSKLSPLTVASSILGRPRLWPRLTRYAARAVRER